MVQQKLVETGKRLCAWSNVCRERKSEGYEWLQAQECLGIFVVGTVLFGSTNEKASKDL